MERPRTCLVLGGGGARGAAHIGLLKVLERERVPVDCIVGTSMGAIVGGMYAAGYGADEIETILQHVDWASVLHDRTPRAQRTMRRKRDDLRRLGGMQLGLRNGKIAFPRGMIQGQRLELLLRRLLLPTWRIEHFDDLPIPFRAIAADIVTGEKVVFDRGDLPMAIRASMSVPAAFAPVRVDGRLLVDGGIVDNVPIDEARKLGAERLIVSRVGSPLLDEARLNTPLDVSQQALRVLMKHLVEAQVASLDDDDLLLTPPLGYFGAQEFNRASTAIGIGFEAADKRTLDIRRFSASPAEYARFEQHHRLPESDAPLIAFIDVLRDSTRTGTYIARTTQSHLGHPLDLDALDADLGAAYGEDRYEQLQWQLQTRDGRTGLVIEPQDKRWGPGFLHSTLGLSSDFDGNSAYQLDTELTLTGLSAMGAEARLGLGIGRIDRLGGELHQPVGSGHQALRWHAGYRAFDLPVDATAHRSTAEYRYSAWSGGLTWSYALRNRWELSAGLARGRERARLLIGDDGEYTRADLGSFALGVAYDTLDSAAFPRSGQRLDASHRLYRESLGSDLHAGVTRLVWDAVWSWGAHSVLAGIQGSSAHIDKGLALDAYGFLGGLGRLSGYQDDAIFAKHTGLARLVYYRHLGHADSLLSMPVYLGGSLEAGGHSDESGFLGSKDLIGAGSLFLGIDTRIGPIFLGYGRAEHGIDSLYLKVGSMLSTSRHP
ncbi:patatin-like phospholipase family protein [Luteimonas suaedae]|uniref:patatin-like phospholipase family protein n=1 Tax=Luteimonas suaedae TaxID=2605430 RepID=UPI0016594274|nr:patatin-like phospholipase family protein [Luteimonas suaedae]